MSIDRWIDKEDVYKCTIEYLFLLLMFSCQVMLDSSWAHGLQHARLPYPSLSPGVYPSSCPLNLWCHPTVSICHPLLLLPQSFPASGSFPMSQLFPFGGQSIGASASVLPKSILFRIDWFDSLLSKGLSRVFTSTTVWKHQFFCTLPHSYIWTWLLARS